MSIDFCHIVPTPHLENFVEGRSTHLALAHLIETDSEYASFYRSQVNSTIILDNSAFEMYKQGRPMYPSDKLVEMGHRIGARYIVMSDYPNQKGQDTIDAAIALAPVLRDNGFRTFFVPQSEIGDKEDYIQTFRWAAQSEHVDYIGISILGVPNAYGVEKNNKLQRFLSRWKMMRELYDRGLLWVAQCHGKKIHFLGMVDGPNEITLMSDLARYIDTWDSSAAVWAGLNNISFDDSPTGLVDGKFEVEVDFNFETGDNELFEIAMENMNYIDGLCRSSINEYQV
jgi:hypothetical protein